MNERIEKLKESACPKIDWAGRYHVELNNGEKEKWMNEWFEKFTELIVQECVNWIDGSPATEEGTLILSKSFIIANLKQHFGVEE